MMSRRSVLCALGALPAAVATPVGGRARTNVPTAVAGSLRHAAASGDRYFGAAARYDQLAEDDALREAVLRDCNSLTPEIHMKWDALRPSARDWTTGPADRLVGFAHEHGLAVRGHALLWDQSTPEWARRSMAGDGWALVEDHFARVLGRYADRVMEWDVVNEPIGDDGGLRPNLFARRLGTDYVERALNTAHALAPGARLFINDYSLEYDNPVEADRRRGMVAMAKRLRAQGAPLHGVGLQAHLDLGKGPLKAEILRPFLSELADLGLELAVTELDVKETDLSLPLAERDRRVSDEVRRYLDIVLDEPAVKGVTTWGLSDRDSWLQTAGVSGPNLNRGLPYDADWRVKPMRAALGQVLAA